MKKRITALVALCVIMVMPLSACTGKSEDAAGVPEKTTEILENRTGYDPSDSYALEKRDYEQAVMPGGQIANPFVYCNTIQEARDITGFGINVPEKIKGYEQPQINAFNSSMIQVSYGNADALVLIRKAAGSEDISGDYNIYSDIFTEGVDGIVVTLKGNNGRVSLATWCSDGYSYSLSVPEMSSAEVAELISNIK
ncbi:MAG: hypothetical protein ACI4D0_07635 [Lachnospira sp.]